MDVIPVEKVSPLRLSVYQPALVIRDDNVEKHADVLARILFYICEDKPWNEVRLGHERSIWI